MAILGLDERISALERENRIIKKKLERSEANRVLLEEALASHINALRVRNSEIEESREIIRQSETRYRNLALFDTLTALPNRMLFLEMTAKAINQAAKTKSTFALLYVDIDRFKTVNDKGGHEAGDLVLQETGRRLLSCVRDKDNVARIGGDEFVVLLENLPGNQLPALIAERILTVMAEPFIVKGEAFSVGSSIGISLYPFDGENVEILLEKADAAMYGVKRSGRNAWSFAHELQ